VGDRQASAASLAHAELSPTYGRSPCAFVRERESNVSGDVCEGVYITSGICSVLWLQRGESCDMLTGVNHSIHFGENPVHINQGRVLGV